MQAAVVTADPSSSLNLLVLGLNVLSQAASGAVGSAASASSQQSDGDYFVNGHRGAAMLAAHFFTLRPDLEPATRGRVDALVRQQLVAAAASAGLTGSPSDGFSEQEHAGGAGGCGDRSDSVVSSVSGAAEISHPPPSDLESEVLGAIEPGVETLMEVGHNVIIGTLALRAFREEPRLLTPARARGVAATVRSFHPWPVHPRVNDHAVPRGDLEADAAALGQELGLLSIVGPAQPAAVASSTTDSPRPGCGGAAFAALVLREYLLTHYRRNPCHTD
eukprot:COSAG01_NODE_11398_length_1944_cov_2.230352_2_plen_276_part_00